MIYINNDDITELDFVSLLEMTKENIKSEFANNGIPRGISGVVFENLVFEQMTKASNGSVFHGQIKQTGVHAFPDIVARKLYGVEVKMTVNDKWNSTGNSVLESTRVDGVETIYLFFGKFGKGFDAKFRKYQECLHEVGVTHSPRYKIDMNLPDGLSIFDKLGVSYNVFRKEDFPIKRLKEYYRKQLNPGEELWWIDPASEEVSVSPIIKSFRLLDLASRERFVVECMILFPEIFGKNNKTKFERAAAYLITNYNAVSSSLRDTFTAGGKMNIMIDEKPVKVSKILYHLYVRSNDIARVIEEIPKDRLSSYWRIEIEGNPIEIWQKLLNEQSRLASVTYINGLVRAAK